jgi:hypothetical protein
MERDNTLLALRANIAFDLQKAYSEAERFQGETLRPILKFQNDLLLQLMAARLSRLGNRYRMASAEGKKVLIIETLAKDQGLGQLLIGLVVGMFTVEEYQRYQAMSSPVNKRIKALIGQRLESQLHALDSLLGSFF